MLKILVAAPNIKKDAQQGLHNPTASLLCGLSEAGYAVVCTDMESEPDGMEALLGAFEGRPPDFLLMDLSGAYGSLPLQHARRMLRRIWGDDVSLPLCLSLLSLTHLKQSDWTSYTDDFLLPPYALTELLARLSLLRFRRRHVPADNLLRFADVILDLNGKRALDHALTPLSLTPREYDLLAFLITHRGKFFGRDRLLDLVWGIHFEGGERTVDIHVRRLRAKLPPQAADRLQTRRGTGYGFAV